MKYTPNESILNYTNLEMVGLDSYAEFDSIPLTTRNIGRNYKAFGNDKVIYKTVVKILSK